MSRRIAILCLLAGSIFGCSSSSSTDNWTGTWTTSGQMTVTTGGQATNSAVSGNRTIVANGEIWNVDDARRCREISGCDDLMIGRGAVANPALALMIGGQRNTPLAWSEMLQLLQRFWQSVETHIDARHRNGRIKQWLHYLTRHYPQAQQQFDIIRRVTDPAAIAGILFEQRTTLTEAHIQRVA